MTKFNKGDIVTCITDRWAFITKSKQYTVSRNQIGGQVHVLDNDGDEGDYPMGDFLLAQAAPRSAELKLPLAVEHTGSGNRYCVTVGSSSAYVTLVSEADGAVYKDYHTKASCLSLLQNGTWKVRGRHTPNQELVLAVERAKAALAAAEEALANDKPYLT